MLSLDPAVARSARTRATVYVTVALLLGVTYLIRKTLIVFAIAFMFAYLLYPLVDGIDRRVSRKWHMVAVGAPFILLLLFLTGMGLILKVPVREQTERLVAQMMSTGFKERLENWTPLDIPVGSLFTEYHAQLLGMIPQLGRGLRVAERDLLNMFIIPILSFFMLKDGRRIREHLLKSFPDQRKAVERVLYDAHALMLGYMRGLLTLCLAVLISFSIGLSLMHVHYSLLLALLAAPLEFIPVVGPLISAAVIIGVSAFNRYSNIPGLVAFLMLYRLFQDYVISPHLMRKSVKLHPLLVVFGVFAGGDIGGVAGIFFSVPVLALLRLIYYEFGESRALSQRAGASA